MGQGLVSLFTWRDLSSLLHALTSVRHKAGRGVGGDGQTIPESRAPFTLGTWRLCTRDEWVNLETGVQTELLNDQQRLSSPKHVPETLASGLLGG